MSAWFKIDSIEYGWFTMRIGSDYAEVSDYLGYDFPKKFLQKILNVLQEDGKEEWLYLMDEPGAEIMQIAHDQGKITLTVYDLSKECFSLSSKEEKEKDNRGECRFRFNCETKDVVDGLVREFYLYENGNGRGLYETHWMEFPVEEYEKLKKLAFEMDRNASEYDKMYCIDTMCPQRLQ